VLSDTLARKLRVKLHSFLESSEGMSTARPLFNEAIPEKALIRRRPLLLFECGLRDDGVAEVNKFDVKPLEA
jgi:hypothetical protein